MKNITLTFLGIIGFFQLFSQSTMQQIELAFLKKQFDSVLVMTNQMKQTDSSNWLVYYYAGKSYHAKHEFFEAIHQYEEALDLDSANIVIENELAEGYDFVGKDEDAIKIYYNQYLRDTLAQEPVVRLANIFRQKGEFSAAIHYYQKAVAYDPENFYYYKQLAFCFDKIGIPAGAMYSYQTAIMLNSYDASLYIQLANILNTERMFVDAIEACNQGLVVHKENNQLLKIKAYAHYLNRDFDSSLVGFNKLLENEDSTLFNLKYRGLAFFEKKQFVNAIRDLRLAYEINEKDAELCFYLGSAFSRSNQNMDGLSYLNKSLNLLSPSPNELSNIYSEMANAYLNQKKYEWSLEYLKKAYRNKATPLLSFKMAQLHDYYLKNTKLAIDCYEAYLTMVNVSDTTLAANRLTNSFLEDPQVAENAHERIRFLKEELFFEEARE